MSNDTIETCLEAYFHGLYTGDLEALRRAFHPHARLTGVIQGEPYGRALEEYLALVKVRVSPQARGEVQSMSAVSIERKGDIAAVRARVQMLGFDYTDFLSLVREKGRWSIVHKNFTHEEG